MEMLKRFHIPSRIRGAGKYPIAAYLALIILLSIAICMVFSEFTYWVIHRESTPESWQWKEAEAVAAYFGLVIGIFLYMIACDCAAYCRRLVNA
jgi:xanthine/uracil/vitamin C permease (AzgA family)